MRTATTQIRRYVRSGARIYIPQGLLNRPEFPFEDDEILKVEILDGRLVLSRPEWWEMLDWDEMPLVWGTLPEEIKAKVWEAGLAPKEES